MKETVWLVKPYYHADCNRPYFTMAGYNDQQAFGYNENKQLVSLITYKSILN